MPMQHIANIVGRNMLCAFGHRVAMCCDMLGVVSSSLKMVKFEPTTPNMSQHGGQTHATCCVQQCCDMLPAKTSETVSKKKRYVRNWGKPISEPIK